MMQANLRIAAWWRESLRLLLGCCIAGSASTLLAAPAAQWPVIPMPEHASSFPVGDQLDLNGVPMHVQGFVTEEDVAHVAAWYRRGRPGPLAESLVGSKLILGRPQDGFYWTVQLEPAGRGTRGIVAVSDIRSALDGRDARRQFGGRWQQRLPAGSRVVSQSSSEDRGRISSQLVFVNGLSTDLNRDRVGGLMTDDGYALERDTEVAEGSHVAASVVGSHVMRFKGGSKEATAVITRLKDGRSAVVLSTISQVETIQ